MHFTFTTVQMLHAHFTICTTYVQYFAYEVNPFDYIHNTCTTVLHMYKCVFSSSGCTAFHVSPAARHAAVALPSN